MKRKMWSFLILLFVSPASADPPQPSPEQIAEKYVSALIREDWKEAADCWDPEEVIRAGRLGIRYEGRPLKFDCTSPLYDYLPAFRAGSAAYRIARTDRQAGKATVECWIDIDDQSYLVPYHAIRRADGWRLISALGVYTGSWKRIDTKYVAIHAESDRDWNRHSLDRIDRFISEFTEKIGLPSERAALLEKEKLDYYLCDEESIRRLSGFETHGITMLAWDAVLSRHLPHDHEVAHLLLNFALGDATLNTPVALQEGLAVAFGGRWEKSAAVMLDVGRFLVLADPDLAEKIVLLDEVFADMAAADLTYPVAGLYVRFLVDRYGMESFIELYKRLADPGTLTPHQKSSVIERTVGDAPDMIQQKFLEYVKQFPSSGIDPYGHSISPHSPSSIREIGGGNYISTFSDNRYLIHWVAKSDSQSVSILLDPTLTGRDRNYVSSLFQQHFPGRPYDGTRYSIRFGPGEAGLYDYYVNELTAKFVEAFRPGESLRMGDSPTYSFEIRRSLIAGELDDYTIQTAAN